MSEDPTWNSNEAGGSDGSGGRGVSRSRKLMGGFGAGVVLTLVILIVAMVNYLAYRHHHAFDWTRQGYYQLSSQTQNLLHNLSGPLQVVVMFGTADEGTHDYVKTLLNEYSAQSTKVTVEFLDPNVTSPARIKQLVKDFGLNENDQNVVIFKYGDKSKFLKHDMYSSDLVDYDMAGGAAQGRAPKIANYKAEAAFTSAIINVTEEKQQKVYFLQGHGESSPEDPSPRKGLSELKGMLVRQNLQVETLSLNKTGKVPEDCAALAIVGPTASLSTPEMELIGKYLDNKGRLLLMADPEPANLGSTYGLGELLAKWNVKLDGDIVIEPRYIQIGEKVGLLGNPLEVYVEDYVAHPITNSLKGVGTVFPGSRSVRALNTKGGVDLPRVANLIETTKAAYGETSVADYKNGKLKPDEGVDLKGPLAVAVAVESGAPGSDVNLGNTRVVLVGNSLGVTNGGGVEGNVTFTANAINWLMERKKLIGIAPKATRSYQLQMSPRQLNWVTYGTAVGLPVLAAFCGLMVWWRRRR